MRAKWTIALLLLAAIVLSGCTPRESVLQHPSDVVPPKPVSISQRWEAAVELPWMKELFVVAFGNGRFVAGGWDTLLTSDDGLNWAPVATPLKEYIVEALAYGNGQFVALAHDWRRDNLFSLRSTDGIHWEQLPMPQNDYPTAQLFTFDKGTFLLVGDERVYLSPDGITWETVTIAKRGEFRHNAVAYAAGKFVVVGARGRVATSEDGRRWSSQSSGTSATLITVGAYQGGVVAGGTVLLQSKDGADWERWTEVCTYCDTQMTVGDQLFLLDKGELHLHQPDHGWTSHRLPGDEAGLTYQSMAYGAGRYVLVGDGAAIATSPDARTWEVVQSSFTGGLRSISYGADRFVAVGGVSERAGIALVSRDGKEWSRYNIGKSMAGVTHTGAQFVAVAGHWAATSPDGATWDLHLIGTEAGVTEVAYGAGLLVAVGAPGKAFTSPDGREWTERQAGTTDVMTGSLSSVTYGNGLFVAVTLLGAVITSSDGVTWQVHHAPLGCLKSVAFNAGRFMAAACRAGPGGLITSTDGKDWQLAGDAGQDDFRVVVPAGDGWIALTHGKRFYTSANGTEWALGDSADIRGYNAGAYGQGLVIGLYERGLQRLRMDD